MIATFVEKISDAESDTVLSEVARWKGDGCSPTSSFDNCKERVSRSLAEAGLQLRSWATDADGSNASKMPRTSDALAPVHATAAETLAGA